MLGNRRDAEDAAQDVFAKVYFSIKGFDGRTSLYAWMHRAAVNECYSVLRRKRQRLLVGDVGDHSTSVRAHQRSIINELLEHVPELDRQLLLLREMEGYSVADIGQATGLNQKAIKARLFRVRQRLAKAAAQFSLSER